MKQRYDLKYQLFINEQTGVATCKLVNIKLADWVSEETCSNYDELNLARYNVLNRYFRKGWPIAHATPSSTAKRDSKFGMRLAKKRLIYKVMVDLYNELELIAQRWASFVNNRFEFLLMMEESLNRLDDSITDLYVTAGINEGEYDSNMDKDTLRAVSHVDAAERLYGGDNNG